MNWSNRAVRSIFCNLTIFSDLLYSFSILFCCAVLSATASARELALIGFLSTAGRCCSCKVASLVAHLATWSIFSLSEILWCSGTYLTSTSISFSCLPAYVLAPSISLWNTFSNHSAGSMLTLTTLLTAVWLSTASITSQGTASFFFF